MKVWCIVQNKYNQKQISICWVTLISKSKLFKYFTVTQCDDFYSDAAWRFFSIHFFFNFQTIISTQIIMRIKYGLKIIKNESLMYCAKQI